MEAAEEDAAVLFIQYLEGRMEHQAKITKRLAALPKIGCPEVGEGGPLDKCLLFKNGRTSILKDASSAQLSRLRLSPYPHYNLTTQHALIITRALATLHAHAAGTDAAQRSDSAVNESFESRDLYLYSKCPTTTLSGGPQCSMAELEECNGECGDLLTPQITQAKVADANLSILIERLSGNEQYRNVVSHLKNLPADLPTLGDFIHFSSAVSKKWVASIGPVSACDFWISEDDNSSDDVIAIRLRGGSTLRAPPLRDVAWVWLTLIEPTNLRDRYSELCDEYCNAFNAVYHRLTAQPGQPVHEVLSYVDVMRDLGECFLHAFFTLLHKFGTSGTWYLDRNMHEDSGIVTLVAIIEFLIDNGIVGSIFIA